MPDFSQRRTVDKVIGRPPRLLRLGSILGAAGLIVSATGSVAAHASTDRTVHGQVAQSTGLPRGQGATARCALSGQSVPGTYTTITDVAPGRSFSLTADAGSWQTDFDIAFYATGPVCNGTAAVRGLTYTNFAGDEFGVVPAGATFAIVTLASPGANEAFTYREFDEDTVTLPNPDQQRPTVVAIIEPTTAASAANGFSPYHLDFSGAEHPWNKDANPNNDIDFTADPSTYLPGYPGADAVNITVPTGPGQDVSTLGDGPDKAAWASMELSPADGASAHLYRLPGTKIIGGATFAFGDGSVLDAGSGSIYSPDNLESHGTKTSSVAAGNIHGTCPECVLVLLRGNTAAAMTWATSQRWIDVISNSYGATGAVPNPSAPLRDVIRNGVEDGQSSVWAAGNGLDDNDGVPWEDYTDYRPGADWGVTVGGVSVTGDQSNGASRPVDVASYDEGYPAVGGKTSDGQARFSGTSNAAPVVAGTLAEIILAGRALLGDTTPGHHDGIVAEGQPRACEGPATSCPLDDGVLTRAEVQSVLYNNVYTSPARPDGLGPSGPANSLVGTSPSVPSVAAYTAQGHGIVHGRYGATRYAVEQRRFLDALRGAWGTTRRPPGERAWMTADSLCRQRLWGTWDGGYYHDGDAAPAFDPTTDGPAMALWSTCNPLPPDSGTALRHLADGL
ncbi:MAG: serine protease [Acidimicrobiaceae bacterium]|nr:serine protease [Acidimicrobiaceae bacterium]